MSSLIKKGVIGSKRSVLLAYTPPQAASPSKDSLGPDPDHQLQQVKEIDRIREEARKLGYEEGIQTAKHELSQKIAELDKEYQQKEIVRKNEMLAFETQLTETVNAIKTHADELAHVFEQKLIALTLECLYKLAGHKEFYKEIVEENVKKRLGSWQSDNQLRIRLPKSCTANFESLAIALEGKCILIFDADIKPGECFVESGFATEDINIVTLVEQIKDTLLSTLGARLGNAGH